MNEAIRMQIDLLYRSDLLINLVYISFVLLFSAIVGKIIGFSQKKRRWIAGVEDSNFIPSTILGLMALVLGFTFSMAVSRYEVRRNMTVQESNAIGTAYLRANLLSTDSSRKIQDLLVEYLKLRIEFHEVKIDEDKKKKLMAETSNVLNALWKEIMLESKGHRDPITALNVSALNAVIDISAERYFATVNRIPELVFFILLFIGTIGIGSLGFLEGYRGDKTVFNVFVLSVLFAMVIGLIFDLDRPQRGLIQNTQEPLLLLQKSIEEGGSYHDISK